MEMKKGFWKPLYHISDIVRPLHSFNIASKQVLLVEVFWIYPGGIDGVTSIPFGFVSFVRQELLIPV